MDTTPTAPDLTRIAQPAVRPVVLLILDGFGCRPDAPDNAISRADAPHWRHLLATCPHTVLDASELRVGLPEGQMGNSEVGHLNIGAGRVVYQDFTRIDVAIRDGEFARNPALVDAVATAKRNRSTLHVPLSQLGARAGELARSAKRPVIVYCDRGVRARGAAGVLGKQGFERVYLLRGGFRAWRDAGLPVHKT
jgi:rhodanese-related sulfurtransferase